MMNKAERPCVPAEEDHSYYYDDCLARHLASELAAGPGCRVPWLDGGEGVLCGSGEAVQAARLYQHALTSAACHQPCCTMEVDLTSATAANQANTTSIQLRFPPTVKESGSDIDGEMSFKLFFKKKLLSIDCKFNVSKVYKEIEIYALFNLLAELGGYLGMFLGVSLLDLKALTTYLPRPTSVNTKHIRK